jgi:hypothetical protein
MSLIESLTEAQIARIPEFVERWTKIGLCTDPADRPRAEAAIREMYRQGGLEPPSRIVWCGSPLSQWLTQAIMIDCELWDVVADSVWDSVRTGVWHRVLTSLPDSVRASVRDSVEESVWDSGEDAESVGDRMRASVAVSVRASVWDRVRDRVAVRVRDSVWVRVRDSVVESVRDSVQLRVWDSVWDSVRDSVEDSVWDSGEDEESMASAYGSHDAGWLAFYRYFHDVIGLTNQTEKLSGLWELAQSAGWALPHQNICWVSERHHILERDDRGRLHRLDGPAVAYPDGFAIYAVHGVRVPRHVVEEPGKISVASISAERNVEVRRVMIECYRRGEEVSGAAAYVRDSGAERLDHDERFGTLYRRDAPGDEPIVMLEVVNSTPEPDGSSKRYWLRVPPQMQTAREASAWTFGLTPKEYDPLVET